MKKIAIFGEGQTELIFTRKLLEELAGYQRIVIEWAQVGIHRLTVQRQSEQSICHFALLYDCGADNQVKSTIADNLPTLAQAGYSAVIGLRDLYPRPRQDYDKLISFPFNAPQGLAVDIIVPIMEVEAWFIGEYKHFSRWNSNLTTELIKDRLGIDVIEDEFELLAHPAKSLNDIYLLVARKGYKKSKWFVDKIVSLLDFEFIYIEVRQRSASLDRLLSCIDRFLA